MDLPNYDLKPEAPRTIDDVRRESRHLPPEERYEAERQFHLQHRGDPRHKSWGFIDEDDIG